MQSLIKQRIIVDKFFGEPEPKFKVGSAIKPLLNKVECEITSSTIEIHKSMLYYMKEK